MKLNIFASESHRKLKLGLIELYGNIKLHAKRTNNLIELSLRHSRSKSVVFFETPCISISMSIYCPPRLEELFKNIKKHLFKLPHKNSQNRQTHIHFHIQMNTHTYNNKHTHINTHTHPHTQTHTYLNTLTHTHT